MTKSFSSRFNRTVAFALIFNAQEVFATVIGLILWFGALYALRTMAKSDPKIRFVYLKHRTYKSYYPVRSNPIRDNTNNQERHYR